MKEEAIQSARNTREIPRVSKERKRTKISSFKIDYGSFLISIYSFVSMVTIFVFHGIARECSLQLHSMFSERFPSESQTWVWSLECRMNPLIAWITGTIAGIVVFVAVYCLTSYGMAATHIERYEKQDYASKRRNNITVGGIAICIFFAIFVIASFLSDPHLVYRSPDMLYSLVLGGIVGLSITLYNGNRMRRVRRRDFCDDRTLQLEEFRFDHESTKETFHLSLFAFVTLLVSVFFVSVYRFFQQLPPEILYSDPFVLMTSKNAGYAVIMTVGFFVGILLQELQNLVDVRYALRELRKDTRMKSS